MINLNKFEKQKLINLLKKEENTKANNLLIKKIENSMRQIKPRSAKNKGLEWQKEVCGIISRITGIPYDQSSDDCEIHSRESSLPGVDVILRGKAKALFNFAVECKHCKNISLPEWIRQAESNADGQDNWLLLVKSPVLSCKKIAVLNLNKFVDIMEENEKKGSNEVAFAGNSTRERG